MRLALLSEVKQYIIHIGKYMTSKGYVKNKVINLLQLIQLMPMNNITDDYRLHYTCP